MINPQKLHKSFGYALSGFMHTLARQQNMRIHFLLAAFALGIASLLHIDRIEFLVLLCAIFLVLFAEMINTVIEETLDFVTREHHPEIQIAKDVAAGAVLLTAVFSIIVGAVVFVPHILNLFYR